MKKVITIVLLCLLSNQVMAGKLNLDNPSIVEYFGANIIKKKFDTYDSDTLAIWYLKDNYKEKWYRVKNDEFEFDGAKIWALNQLKKQLSDLKPIDKEAEYHLYLKASFGKYNFKLKGFPIKALSEDSYMTYHGKGIFVDNYYAYSSKLFFENANNKFNFIPMEKTKAKKFINSKKDRYGNINRRLTAHYIYKITNFTEDRKFKSNGSTMTIKFTGKIKSVEFIDRKNILYRVDFNSNNENNITK